MSALFLFCTFFSNAYHSLCPHDLCFHQISIEFSCWMLTFAPVLQLQNDGDFMYLVADAAAVVVINKYDWSIMLFHCEIFYSNSLCSVFFFSGFLQILQFQYGNPDRLCKPLVEAKKAGEDLVV